MVARIWILIVCAGAFLFATGCGTAGKAAGTPPEPPPMPVVVVQVAPRDVPIFAEFAAQTYARNMVEVKKEMEAKGFVKPMVASLAGDVEVEEAAEYLYQNGIPAYAYSTELPVEVLGAKYKWARGAGLL